MVSLMAGPYPGSTPHPTRPDPTRRHHRAAARRDDDDSATADPAGTRARGPEHERARAPAAPRPRLELGERGAHAAPPPAAERQPRPGRRSGAEEAVGVPARRLVVDVRTAGAEQAARGEGPPPP